MISRTDKSLRRPQTRFTGELQVTLLVESLFKTDNAAVNQHRFPLLSYPSLSCALILLILEWWGNSFCGIISKISDGRYTFKEPLGLILRTVSLNVKLYAEIPTLNSHLVHRQFLIVLLRFNLPKTLIALGHFYHLQCCDDRHGLLNIVLL